MTNEQRLPAPPYVSFRTFLNFIEWLGEVGVPTRMDRTFWGQKLSGIGGSQVMSALRFLGLLSDEDRPDPYLDRLAENGDQRKSGLRELLQSHYAPALRELDLERATPGELRDRFAVYGFQGDTLRKAVAFFVHAAQYAELPLSTHISRSTKTRRANSGRPRRRRTAPQAPATVSATPEPPPAAPASPSILDELGPAIGSTGVRWLIQRLPKPGTAFTDAERETWHQAASAVFEMEYKKDKQGE